MRIVAFGCSFTYGHGLPDCYDVTINRSGFSASKLAWPQILANEMNADCINMSQPGASNKEILHTLLNFNFDASDVVIIMWSFIDRWCILKDYTLFDRLAIDGNVDAVMQYDKIFTVDDLQLDFIYRANFAKFYLDNKNLKNHHVSVKPEEFCPTVMPQWNAVSFSKMSLTEISKHTPPALDTLSGYPHPGVEAHSMAAMALHNELLDAYNK
jgi:hypothetical protein